MTDWVDFPSVNSEQCVCVCALSVGSAIREAITTARNYVEMFNRFLIVL